MNRQQRIPQWEFGKSAGATLEKFPLPLPPLTEQHEIVLRVEQLFTLADQLEARYAKAQAHMDKLTQSLLAKASRGELLCQDLNGEPASTPLMRIRSETNGTESPREEKPRWSHETLHHL